MIFRSGEYVEPCESANADLVTPEQARRPSPGIFTRVPGNDGRAAQTTSYALSPPAAFRSPGTTPSHRMSLRHVEFSSKRAKITRTARPVRVANLQVLKDEHFSLPTATIRDDLSLVGRRAHGRAARGAGHAVNPAPW
jgi:hypothetical protein